MSLHKHREGFRKDQLVLSEAYGSIYNEKARTQYDSKGNLLARQIYDDKTGKVIGNTLTPAGKNLLRHDAARRAGDPAARSSAVRDIFQMPQHTGAPGILPGGTIVPTKTKTPVKPAAPSVPETTPPEVGGIPDWAKYAGTAAGGIGAGVLAHKMLSKDKDKDEDKDEDIDDIDDIDAHEDDEIDDMAARTIPGYLEYDPETGRHDRMPDGTFFGDKEPSVGMNMDVSQLDPAPQIDTAHKGGVAAGAGMGGAVGLGAGILGTALVARALHNKKKDDIDNEEDFEVPDWLNPLSSFRKGIDATKTVIDKKIDDVVKQKTDMATDRAIKRALPYAAAGVGAAGLASYAGSKLAQKKKDDEDKDDEDKDKDKYKYKDMDNEDEETSHKHRKGFRRDQQMLGEAYGSMYNEGVGDLARRTGVGAGVGAAIGGGLGAMSGNPGAALRGAGVGGAIGGLIGGVRGVAKELDPEEREKQRKRARRKKRREAEDEDFEIPTGQNVSPGSFMQIEDQEVVVGAQVMWDGQRKRGQVEEVDVENGVAVVYDDDGGEHIVELDNFDVVLNPEDAEDLNLTVDAGMSPQDKREAGEY